MVKYSTLALEESFKNLPKRQTCLQVFRCLHWKKGVVLGQC